MLEDIHPALVHISSYITGGLQYLYQNIKEPSIKSSFPLYGEKNINLEISGIHFYMSWFQLKFKNRVYSFRLIKHAVAIFILIFVSLLWLFQIVRIFCDKNWSLLEFGKNQGTIQVYNTLFPDYGQFTDKHGCFYPPSGCLLASRYRVKQILSDQGQSATMVLVEVIL